MRSCPKLAWFHTRASSRDVVPTPHVPEPNGPEPQPPMPTEMLFPAGTSYTALTGVPPAAVSYTLAAAEAVKAYEFVLTTVIWCVVLSTAAVIPEFTYRECVPDCVPEVLMAAPEGALAKFAVSPDTLTM